MKRLLLLPALFFALVAQAQTPTLEVVSAIPVSGATNVSTAEAVEVSFTFNEEIDSLHHALDLITLVGSADFGDASLSADKKTVTIQTQHEADTDYLWVVSGSYFIDLGCDPELGQQGETVSMKKPFILQYTTSATAGQYTVSGTLDVQEAAASKTGLSVATLNLGKIRSLSARKAAPQVSAAATASQVASANPALPVARPANVSAATEPAGSIVVLVDAENPNLDYEEVRIRGAAVAGADGSYTINYVRPGAYVAVAMTDVSVIDLNIIDPFGLLSEFVIGAYDTADAGYDADEIVITAASASNIDITMRPASAYAVTMEEAEAEANAFIQAFTGESEISLLGASTFLAAQDGSSAFWTFDYSFPGADEAELISAVRTAFITFTDESTTSAEDLRALPAGYKTASEAMAALKADSRVTAFLTANASATLTTSLLGGDPYLVLDPVGLANPDKLLWKLSILSFGDSVDLLGGDALVGYVDVATGTVVEVQTYSSEPFAYESTARAAATEILSSESPVTLFHVFADGVNPATGEAQVWSHDYFADPAELLGTRVIMSGFISFTLPVLTSSLPEGVATIPAEPASLKDALALADTKVGDEVRAQYGDNYTISVEGGYAEFLLGSDLDVLAVIPDLETTPVWVISYEAYSSDLLGCEIEDPKTAIVVIDMETGAYIKEFGVGITIPNEPGDNLTFETKLGAGFPNPFATEATIPFSLVSASNVSLKVYDVLGREVATLVEGLVSAGEQTARWNAAGQPSGVYFVRLTVDGETLTQKLVLRK